MSKFKTVLFSVGLLAILLVTPQLEARSLLSDAPFPWGSEVPYNWANLHGTWAADTGTSAPLVFQFRVAERGGGIYLVTAQVMLQYRTSAVVAQGYAFVVSDQRYINIPFFGDGAIPLAVLRKYPGNNIARRDGRDTLMLTWVWDVNAPTFVHRHFLLEKISNESDL